MKRFIIFTMTLCCAALLSTSCKEKKFKDYEQTDNGLYYKFLVENKDARSPKAGDWLFIRVSYRTDNDSIIFDTRDVVDLLQESSYPGDLYEAYAMMHEGDEAVFALKADTFFTYMGIPELPSFITDETMVFFNIKMNKIQSSEEIQKEEQDKIKAYIDKNNITATPTESGLYYIETLAGKGKNIVEGDTLGIIYSFKLLNDSIFDSNEGKDPMPCIVGRMLAGMNEAFLKMKQGGKATLIMPYDIAFGPQNPYIPIPPFSTIVADIKIVPNYALPRKNEQTQTKPAPTITK